MLNICLSLYSLAFSKKVFRIQEKNIYHGRGENLNLLAALEHFSNISITCSHKMMALYGVNMVQCVQDMKNRKPWLYDGRCHVLLCGFAGTYYRTCTEPEEAMQVIHTVSGSLKE